MRHTLPLHDALTVFADHLEEIRLAALTNMKYQIDSAIQVPEPTGDGYTDELWGDLRKLDIEQRTATHRKVVRAITGRLQAKGQKRFAAVTDADIARAKEYPVEDMSPNPVRRHQTCCPFHDDSTPSLHIRKDNTWTCYGCNKYGDAIDFYRELHGVGFIQAVKALS